MFLYFFKHLRRIVLFGLAFLLALSSTAFASSKAVKIAIIDTGIDRNHSAVKGRLWVNPGETGLDEMGKPKENNGIDDDLNGFVDDVHGFNFVSNNSDLTDHEGHGTHVAGIITKVFSASSPDLKLELMILKYFDPKDTRRAHKDSFLDALKYAVDKQAHIFNISGGGKIYSHREFELIKAAQINGSLIIAAAGNKVAFSENHLFYPAAYHLPNVLSVVATNDLGQTLSTSNINRSRPNIFLPGERINSALPGESSGFRTGSSQAAATLTGKIASWFHRFKESKDFDISTHLKNSAYVVNTPN